MIIFDERRTLWAEAEQAGRAARLEDDPMTANPYHPETSHAEAALYICWRRGWMDVDRELLAREHEAAEGEDHRSSIQKLIAL